MQLNPRVWQEKGEEEKNGLKICQFLLVDHCNTGGGFEHGHENTTFELQKKCCMITHSKFLVNRINPYFDVDPNLSQFGQLSTSCPLLSLDSKQCPNSSESSEWVEYPIYHLKMPEPGLPLSSRPPLSQQKTLTTRDTCTIVHGGQRCAGTLNPYCQISSYTILVPILACVALFTGLQLHQTFSNDTAQTELFCNLNCQISYKKGWILPQS